MRSSRLLFLSISAPVAAILAGCATVPPEQGLAPRSPREAYGALLARCSAPATLTQEEADVVCFPNAKPDFLDCVVPAERPRYSCDIRVHARAFAFYRPVEIGRVRVTVEAGEVVSAVARRAKPIPVATPHVTAIGG